MELIENIVWIVGGFITTLVTMEFVEVSKKTDKKVDYQTHPHQVRDKNSITDIVKTIIDRFSYFISHVILIIYEYLATKRNSNNYFSTLNNNWKRLTLTAN